MKISGCFKVCHQYNYVFRFVEGSIVYRCDKAHSGRLEAIWIKSIRLVSRSNIVIPIYVDNLNALYNENDLCTHDEATAAATTYLQSRINILDALMATC